MNNMTQKGDVVNVTLAGDVTSGDLVIVGKIVGVATRDGLTGESHPIQRIGVVTLPKTTGAGTGFSQGDLALWDVSAGALDATAAAVGTDTYIGFIAADVADGAATASVILTGEAPTYKA